VMGEVQGVFFRWNTKVRAERLKVKGWVMNKPDGTVEAVFEGEEDAVDKMVEWCHRGPPGASVVAVRVFNEEYRGDFDRFFIKH